MAESGFHKNDRIFRALIRQFFDMRSVVSANTNKFHATRILKGPQFYLCQYFFGVEGKIGV